MIGEHGRSSFSAAQYSVTEPATGPSSPKNSVLMLCPGFSHLRFGLFKILNTSMRSNVG